MLHAGDKANCAAFAYSYQAEAMKHGGPVTVRGCKLTDGQDHAFAVIADGWALDVHQRSVVSVSEVGFQ
ncbi:hypothetical protein [Rhizobium leguminosarum]|uniref:hypothetical protein n=1 Tax=Rhizobium leguminosarum TaxID=384 RepID=UPI001C920434|nr:hypothetical protein [Rhizobium leguminosarum]MBY2983103.1 hypothetical protein [Rhizobium leguminosarum]